MTVPVAERGGARQRSGGIGRAAVLIGARAVQGIGGALMYPQVLAIIQVNFADNERAKALGIFGSVIGIAAVAGQILGGTILALDLWHLEWRLATGMTPENPDFLARWEALLREVGSWIEEAARRQRLRPWTRDVPSRD